MKYFVLVFIFLTGFSMKAQNEEHMVATTSYLYNNSTMTWNYSYRAVINYNENGLRSEDYTYYRDGDSWVFTNSSVKQEYTYDPFGNLYVQINSMWSGNDWNPVWRYIYSYDTESNLMLYEAQNWDGTEWIDWSKNEYYRSEESYYFISGRWISGVYETDSKAEYTYGANGLIDTCVYSSWHDNDWRITSRRAYIYDTNDNLTEELWEEYSNEVYKPTYRFLRQYNANNDKTFEAYQNWNATHNRWDDQYRYSFTYNADNQRTNYLYETWSGYFWNPVTKSEYEYSTATDIDKPEEITSKYMLFNNYPNPFNPTTKISFSIPENAKVLLTIHTSTGERVAVLADELKSPGKYDYTFNADGLASGLYFYKLEVNNYVEVKKMMLLK